MLADLYSPLSWVLQHPVHGVPHGFVWTAVCGLFLAPFCIRLLLTGAFQPVEQFALGTLLTASAVLLVIWTLSWGASHEARHIANPSLAAAPAFIALGWRRVHQASMARWIRLAWLGAFGIAWVGPLLYGPVSVIGKVLTTPPVTLTDTGLRDPMFPSESQAEAIAFLRSQATPNDVWLLGYGNTTFEITGRHLVRYFFNSDEAATYARRRFATRRPVRVCLLIDQVLETDGRGPGLRAQFSGASSWHLEAVPRSSLNLWTAELAPQTDP